MSLVRAESLPGPAHKEVSYLLAQLGPDAIPEFEKAIEDPNDVIRYIAIRALARIRPPTWEAEKALRKAGAELTGSSQNEALAALDELRRARRGERVRQRRMQPVRPR
jgi:HEAT repeat protein